MIYKTAELEGALLDAAVAKAEGRPVHSGPGRFMVAAPVDTRWAHQFHFSGDWKDGGPIIERMLREGLVLHSPGAYVDEYENLDRESGLCRALVQGPAPAPYSGTVDVICYGPTLLIAAMRAYVASKFGEEVELP